MASSDLIAKPENYLKILFENADSWVDLTGQASPIFPRSPRRITPVPFGGEQVIISLIIYFSNEIYLKSIIHLRSTIGRTLSCTLLELRLKLS
jgi:hypothetical protein